MRGDATTSRRDEMTSGQRSDRMMRGRESGTTRGQAMVAVVAVAARGQQQRWRGRRWTVDESMQKLPSPYDKPSSNSATCNHAPQCKQTMPRHTHYSPTKTYPKHSRPWTCGSTGYGAAMLKDNSAITGDLAQNLADYFTMHHPATHHKSVRPTILTSANDPEYRKLFQNSGDSAKSEGTNNYERKENFQKLPKIAESEGTKIYARSKTSENRQKIAELVGTKNTPHHHLPKM
jgi:hypothetical protein